MERDPFESEKDVNKYGYRWNPDPRSRNLYLLFKRGWHQIPVVMFSSILGFIGMGMAAYAIYNYEGVDAWNYKYKTKYTVYRDCDPRIKNLKEHN